jgi:uncharacterized protein
MTIDATISASAPVRPASPARIPKAVRLCLGLTYALALTIAIAMPHMGLAPLLSIFAPITAMAITITITEPKGARRAAWSAVGWRWPGFRMLAISLLLPAAVLVASFGGAGLLGVATFPDLHINGLGVVDLMVFSLPLGTVMILGEEIVWRGFIYPRLSPTLGMKRAAITTGVFHAVFHLPLLLLTTTYQSAGNRLIVVPMVMVTIAAAGVIYAWSREVSGSVWPAAVIHNAFNTFVDLGLMVSVAGSAAALAYVTTETGVLTMLLVVATAAWFLTRTWTAPAPKRIRKMK